MWRFANGVCELAGEVVQKLAGSVEVLVKLFFGTEFGGVRQQRATGAAGGMLDVEHLVIQDVFHDKLGNAGAVHTPV